MEKTILGLITARSGSKGIPGKNIKPLGGKPLIVWTIEAAKAASCLDRLVITTDSPEIAAVGRSAGAEAPFLRPKELARDNSPHIDCVLHAVDWLEQHEGYRPSHVCLLQPTSPFRAPEDIERAAVLALSSRAEGVCTVVESHQHPHFIRWMAPDGLLIPLMPDSIHYPRRQDLPPAFFINGSVYVNQVSSLHSRRTFYPPDLRGIVVPPERSLQIDDLFDFRMAECLLSLRSE